MIIRTGNDEPLKTAAVSTATWAAIFTRGCLATPQIFTPDYIATRDQFPDRRISRRFPRFQSRLLR